MTNSSRTYFVYINERCHLLCHDPQKITWLEYWMKGKIPHTSPDYPPPFGLYPVAMMTHYGVGRYTNLCVWQVSAGQWTFSEPGGDKRDAAFEPLELKYRSETEQQCALNAVYEWVEAHPFERFQHEGVRGDLTHEVKVYYDLPAPKEESSRSWRAHWKRWKWIAEEWQALALGSAAMRDKSASRSQAETVDLTQSVEPRDVVPEDDDEDSPTPEAEREYTAMLPHPTEKTYGLPPAPAPSIFLPPHIFHPANTVPVTPTPRLPTQVFPYCSGPSSSPMTPSPLRRCSTPGLGLGSGASTPSPTSPSLSPSPSADLPFSALSAASVGRAPMTPMTPSLLRSCSVPPIDHPRIFSSSPSILSSPATALLSFSTLTTQASDPARPWGLSLPLAPTQTSTTPIPTPTPIQKPPSPLPLPLSPSTIPPIGNSLAFEISNTPFRATKRPKAPPPSLKRKSTDDSPGIAPERGNDNDDVNGHADKIENEAAEGDEADPEAEQLADEQEHDQEQQEETQELEQILKAEKRAQGPVTDLRGGRGQGRGQGQGAKGTAGRGRAAGGRG